jgi:two-component system cell cycle sensor histidine kinase/response regulator CckA
VVMPNMRGTELALELKARLPNLKIVYMSGYLEQDTCSGDTLEKAIVLQKPFSRDTLIRKIGEALEDKAGAPADAARDLSLVAGLPGWRGTVH